MAYKPTHAILQRRRFSVNCNQVQLKKIKLCMWRKKLGEPLTDYEKAEMDLLREGLKRS
jgi:hypothetical protein